MAEFIGTDGAYLLCGPVVKTVIYSTDAMGAKTVVGEYCVTRHDFLVWHARAAAIVEQMQRENAEAVITSLPKRRRIRG